MWELGNEFLIKILLRHPAAPSLVHGVILSVCHLPLSGRTEGGKQMPLSVKHRRAGNVLSLCHQRAWLGAAFGRDCKTFSKRKEKPTGLQRRLSFTLVIGVHFEMPQLGE